MPTSVDSPEPQSARVQQIGLRKAEVIQYDHLDIVTANGGRRALAGYHSDLQRLLTQRPNAVVVDSIDGDLEATYQLLLTSLD